MWALLLGPASGVCVAVGVGVGVAVAVGVGVGVSSSFRATQEDQQHTDRCCLYLHVMAGLRRGDHPPAMGLRGDSSSGTTSSRVVVCCCPHSS